ncbi:hypothetical protein BDV95DRAFT_595009 [Massariosphaeria phaeospora]|uniref:J domain-containing protein n=1 Tax=Massariosphaeria phaeospora TaxID=100035 RepID=A0A7C8IA25_9PLEO|nr:hypothetical protein BDV95DRAFT_595009 [Massariosphaeria phaeospora]
MMHVDPHPAAWYHPMDRSFLHRFIHDPEMLIECYERIVHCLNTGDFYPANPFAMQRSLRNIQYMLDRASYAIPVVYHFEEYAESGRWASYYDGGRYAVDEGVYGGGYGEGGASMMSRGGRRGARGGGRGGRGRGGGGGRGRGGGGGRPDRYQGDRNRYDGDGSRYQGNGGRYEGYGNTEDYDGDYGSDEGDYDDYDGGDGGAYNGDDADYTTNANNGPYANAPRNSAPPPPPNLYAILHLPRTATPAQMTASYQRLVRESHPDRHAGAATARREEATKMTQELNLAREWLGDERKRRFYDEVGRTDQGEFEAWVGRGGGGEGGGEGGGFGGRGGGGGVNVKEGG